MENSEKEKTDAEESTVNEEVVEEVPKTQTEIPDGKIETDRDVDVEGLDFSEVESGRKTEETVAAEEVIETKEEVMTTSNATVIEEEAEEVPKSADGALAEKTEEVPSVVTDSAPKILEETALPTDSGTNVEESSEVVDSVPDENLATNGNAGNQETSEIPRSIENQQFVAATPRTRTSWTNCCGLLELLKCSNQ